MSVIANKHIDTEVGEIAITAYFMDARDGFNHFADVWVDHKPAIKDVKVHYINRTWERYEGQSVMMSAVTSLEDDRKVTLKREYLDSHNYGRLTPSRKQELEVIWNNDPYIKAYEKVYEELK